MQIHFYHTNLACTSFHRESRTIQGNKILNPFLYRRGVRRDCNKIEVCCIFESIACLAAFAQRSVVKGMSVNVSNTPKKIFFLSHFLQSFLDLQFLEQSDIRFKNVRVQFHAVVVLQLFEKSEEGLLQTEAFCNVQSFAYKSKN